MIENKTILSSTHIKTDRPSPASDSPRLYIHCCVNIVTLEQIRKRRVSQSWGVDGTHTCASAQTAEAKGWRVEGTLDHQGEFKASLTYAAGLVNNKQTK